MIDRLAQSRAPLIAALCFVVTVGYGTLFYSFSVLITDPAAGGEFSRGLLSAAYGGAVLTGGLAAIPIGRLADEHGVRRLIAAGALLGAAACWRSPRPQRPGRCWRSGGCCSARRPRATFYEPAYVAIQQAFAPDARALAIATLTLTAGLSGPIFVPATGALVDGLGWRDATRVLAGALACAAPVALLLIPAHRRGRPADGSRKRRTRRPNLRPFREPRLFIFTAGAVLGYGAIEAIAVHSVARFQELGFGLGTVTFWAGVSGLITLPGRFLLPLLARRVASTLVLGGVLAVIAAATSLMVARRRLLADGRLLRAVRDRVRGGAAAAGDRHGRMDGDGDLRHGDGGAGCVRRHRYAPACRRSPAACTTGRAATPPRWWCSAPPC